MVLISGVIWSSADGDILSACAGADVRSSWGVVWSSADVGILSSGAAILFSRVVIGISDVYILGTGAAIAISSW